MIIIDCVWLVTGRATKQKLLSDAWGQNFDKKDKHVRIGFVWKLLNKHSTFQEVLKWSTDVSASLLAHVSLLKILRIRSVSLRDGMEGKYFSHNFFSLVNLYKSV